LSLLVCDALSLLVCDTFSLLVCDALSLKRSYQRFGEIWYLRLQDRTALQP
jgi:hypothetical protein